MKFQLLQGLITVFTAFIIMFSCNNKSVKFDGVKSGLDSEQKLQTIELENRSIEDVEYDLECELESLYKEMEIAEAYTNAISTQEISQEKLWNPDPVELFIEDDEDL